MPYNYVPTIADLMQSGAAAQADGVRQAGLIQARGIEQRGFNNAQTVSGVGNAVGIGVGDILQRKAELKHQAVADAMARHFADMVQRGAGPLDVLKEFPAGIGEKFVALMHDMKPKPKEDYTLGASRFSGETNQPIATVDATPKTPGTREVKVRNPDGSETIKIVPDVPGDYTSAAIPEKAPVVPAPQPFTLGDGQTRYGPDGKVIASRPKSASAGADDVTDLTPAGLDAAALNYAKTGNLPPLGMGDKVTRKKIINRAAEMMPGLDVASARADFTANQESLKTLQKQRDAITSFEQTAQKNIDVFLGVAGKVVDTGSPMANSLVRQVTGRMLGSTDQAAYDAARQVAINEIAKITANPTLAGQLSDSARREVEAFNPQGATLAQTVRVMRLLKTDMQNRTTALDETIGGIRDRIKKGSEPAAAGKIRARDPQGVLHEAAPGTPLPAGWKQEP